MRRLVQKIINTGMDISTKKALKNVLNFLGLKPENIDRLYVELQNSIHKEAFDSVGPEDKVVFIPHCLRSSKHCKGKISRNGYDCRGCPAQSKCKAFMIKRKAEERGYRAFIVPGGSMTLKIIEREKPKAVLGIGCIKELVMGAEFINVPGQGVELLKEGCIDTDVDMHEVIRILDGRGKE